MLFEILKIFPGEQAEAKGLHVAWGHMTAKYS